MDADSEHDSLSKSDSEEACYATQNRLRMKPHHCHPICSYRLISIHSKGVMFMIIINALFASSTLQLATVLKEVSDSVQYLYVLENSPVMVVFAVSSLLCPFFGWLSDSYVGRYKILVASLYLWLLSIIFMALKVIIIVALDEFILSMALYSFHILALWLSMTCFMACVLPFTIDQLVGGSGEQLSFTIYWIVWAWMVYVNVPHSLSCFSLLPFQLHQIIWFFLISSLFLLAFVMIHCCDHVLMAKPQLSNPIKLIVRVLNYARKHKFPERRSAFTYWEDECPSRIDLGKDKYGGPFTVEEVENVKTLIKLLPLIVCIIGTLGLDGDTGWYHTVGMCEPRNPKFYFSLLRNIAIASWLPIYHFLVYPLFYNCVPSMLRRIGMGICLIVSSQLFDLVIYFAIVDHLALSDSKAASINSENGVHPVGEWLMLLSHLVRDVTKVIVGSITLEFCMAQAPCQVRGLVCTVILSTAGIFVVLYAVLHKVIFIELVFCTARVVAQLVLFVIFLFVSKWYKLRKRQDIIPYHMFAEVQFESNQRQERNWLQDRGYLDSSDSNPESQYTATNR